MTAISCDYSYYMSETHERSFRPERSKPGLNLLSLPYEIRHNIMQHAIQKDEISLSRSFDPAALRQNPNVNLLLVSKAFTRDAAPHIPAFIDINIPGPSRANDWEAVINRLLFAHLNTHIRKISSVHVLKDPKAKDWVLFQQRNMVDFNLPCGRHGKLRDTRLKSWRASRIKLEDERPAVLTEVNTRYHLPPRTRSTWELNLNLEPNIVLQELGSQMR
jgi:hypothetical protein